MKHYYITTEPPIIAVKAEIHVGDFITDKYSYWQWNDDSSLLGRLKVIAGLPNQPTIDRSALSDEECRLIGWVDIDKIVAKHYPFEVGYSVSARNLEISELQDAFIEGFKTAQSINDKKWSDEDVESSLTQMAIECGSADGDIDVNSPASYYKWIENYIKKLNQPKVFEIEAIVQYNKVKILKVL